METYRYRDFIMEDKKQHIFIDDTKYETEVPEGYTGKGRNEAVETGEVCAIIPGVIVDIKVRKGQIVKAGEVVLILEAMKMYNDIEAEINGTVTEIFVSKGDKVAKGQLMIKLN